MLPIKCASGWASDSRNAFEAQPDRLRLVYRIHFRARGRYCFVVIASYSTGKLSCLRNLVSFEAWCSIASISR